MAKPMAKIENGMVENVLWCGDTIKESETLVDPKGRPVGIGYTYKDGKFYRDGVEILTPLEEARKELAELEAAYSEGVNSV